MTESVNDAVEWLPLLDAIIQWVIIPIIGVLFWMNKRHNDHDMAKLNLEAENRRILTIIEGQQAARSLERQETHETMMRLSRAIETLNERLDSLIMNHTNGH